MVPKRLKSQQIDRLVYDTLPWTPVKSSNISRIANSITGLTVEFTNGSAYHYPSLKQEDLDGLRQTLVNGDSIGKYLHNSIKPNYDYAKVIPLQDKKERASP